MKMEIAKPIGTPSKVISVFRKDFQKRLSLRTLLYISKFAHLVSSRGRNPDQFLKVERNE